MAGRTQNTAALVLRLYKGEDASGFAATWVSLFTTNPVTDINGLLIATEWGPARNQIFGNSGLGAPFWSDPVAADSFKQRISNVGSIQWNSITLSTSPNSVVGFGLWDAQVGGNLISWGPLDDPVPVADGQDFVLGSGVVKVEAD